ncbi:unnamed protein product [marine sediment metagenome]|uniref:Uncharacterized protein n=1 Tax=marine sediment metagenome TaxID=412755 RepID=X0V896_9ZZZZ
MVHPEGVDFDGMILCGKGQKECKSVAVSFDGIIAYPFYVGKIFAEKLMDTN